MRAWLGLFGLIIAVPGCGGGTGSDVDASAPDGAPAEDGGRCDACDASQGSDAGSSFAKAWAFGADATRLYFDGASWSVDSQAPSSDGGAAATLWAAWKSSASLWVVGDGWLVERYHDEAWQTLPSPKGVGLGVDAGFTDDSGLLKAIWGTSDDDVWVAETQGGPRPFLHWDGSTWTRSADDVSIGVLAMYGTSGSDIWAVGEHTDGVKSTTLVVCHYDGSHWTMVSDTPAGTDIGYAGLIAFAPSDTWVGAVTSAWHWDGATWTTASAVSHASSFFGASQDLWAATANSTMHFDGKTWTAAPTKVTASTLALGGASTSDLWAVGANGDAAHFDGANWEALPTGVGVTLDAVVAVSDDLGK